MLRILSNFLIMAGELAAVAAVVAAGYLHPFAFAAATALIALVLGAGLERARLINELPFYFGGGVVRRRVMIGVVAAGEALFKAVLAGVAALLTFSGTDRPRLAMVALALAAVLYAGTNLLRWLTLRFGARPARWGFFRLAAPLGLLFSAALAGLGELGLIAMPRLGDIATRLIFVLPERPSIAQASELVFSLKLYFDGMVTALLASVMPSAAARAASVIVSVNVLTGFVLAVYAVVIADLVRRLEGGGAEAAP